jgi:hypothetical protein
MDGATATAWGRFVAGEELGSDEVGAGLRPSILASWLRCRDEYHVDPWRQRAPRASDEQTPHTLDDDVVLAQLAGIAKSIESEMGERGGLVAVADGSGRILTAWGDRRALRSASESNLAPWCAWSERSAGTNGVGTALETTAAALVSKSEHWCAGFHDWSCAGIAIRDPVTRHPLGILDVSSCGKPFSEEVLRWLSKAVGPIERELRREADRALSALLTVYEAHRRTARGLLLAADNGGRLVAANEEGRHLLDWLKLAFGTPTSPEWLDPQVPELTDVILRGVDRARTDTSWIGCGQLLLPARATELILNFRPAVAEERVVGLLISVGAQGERLTADVPEPPSRPTRILAIQARRLILLSPAEIRFAEAEGNTVWIHADQGRIRAFARGLGVLEEKLHSHGFLRVHRRFLVNLDRVREVVPSFKGGFELITDGPPGESIPVSRRRAAQVRANLGL